LRGASTEQTKTLKGIEEMSFRMGLLWCVTAGWALLWGAAIAGGAFSRDDNMLVIFLMGFGPVGLQLWFVLHRASKRDAARAAMLAEAGVSPSSGFDYTEKGTGIAINTQARTLTLLDGGFWKTYLLSDVREWKCQKRQDPGENGLFLFVKDIERPNWRIDMKEVRTQARWMELLQQQINER